MDSLHVSIVSITLLTADKVHFTSYLIYCALGFSLLTPKKPKCLTNILLLLSAGILNGVASLPLKLQGDLLNKDQTRILRQVLETFRSSARSADADSRSRVGKKVENLGKISDKEFWDCPQRRPTARTGGDKR